MTSSWIRRWMVTLECFHYICILRTINVGNQFYSNMSVVSIFIIVKDSDAYKYWGKTSIITEVWWMSIHEFLFPFNCKLGLKWKRKLDFLWNVNLCTKVGYIWEMCEWLVTINSLALGRSECDSKNVIFNLVLLTGIFRFSHDNALRWMPQDLIVDKSTLVQVMAWCHQATSHYLSQCWFSSLSPNGIARP